MERKLATIQRIDDIQPIEGADRIEVASVLGWKVVVQKGLYSVGDLVIYCEVDSVLPEKPEFEFMRERHFRVKTIKLRGQISQGLLFPVSIISDMGYKYTFDVGNDVTDILGIIKYEPAIAAQLAGQVGGNFPDFISKTDETRLQSAPSLLYELFPPGQFNIPYYISEKLDGASATFYRDYNGHFGVCSRNWELKETEGNSYWRVARELDLEHKLYRDIPTWIQGEIVGPGIQKNRYNLDKVKLFVFNAGIIGNPPFEFELLQEFCYNHHLAMVPTIARDMTLQMSMDEWIAQAEGKSLLNPSVEREGIVVRPMKYKYSQFLHGQLSFKVISNRFLLKNGE